MGSSYYGEPSLGNGRSGSSSRKGKKSNSEKPKQPQRGLGVAQLEKIRLRNQMGCGYLPSFHSPCHANLNQEEDARLEMAFSPSVSSSSYPSPSPAPYGFHPNIVMGMGDMEPTDIRFGESQPSGSTARWNSNSNFIQAQHAAQSNIARHFLRLPMEDSTQKKRRHDRCDSMGSSSQNSDASETQELDLELKLSI